MAVDNIFRQKQLKCLHSDIRIQPVEALDLTCLNSVGLDSAGLGMASLGSIHSNGFSAIGFGPCRLDSLRFNWARLISVAFCLIRDRSVRSVHLGSP